MKYALPLLLSLAPLAALADDPTCHGTNEAQVAALFGSEGAAVGEEGRGVAGGGGVARPRQGQAHDVLVCGVWGQKVVGRHGPPV